jgi:threonine aldolase
VKPSDFRSDTVTRPTDAMRREMARAEVGDDVLDGDPTVRRLEQRVAEWLGKDGAMFVPSGTMANQVSIGSWVRPGGEVVAGERAHLLVYEAGALGALHGAQARTLPDPDGVLDPDAVRGAIRPDNVHCPPTALVALEQTHMASGGRVVPLGALAAVADVARAAGVPVHLDGARLANAVVASGVPAERYAEVADSVSMCFSKGLGAPVGSVVAGSAEFLSRARVLRKRFGGWMRQSGILAAAALYALDHNVERLADDHALARELAAVLDARRGISCSPEEVETNLVMAEVGDERGASGIAAALAEHGVLAIPISPRTLRFVTHMDVSSADVERLRGVLEAIRV